jgi:hypothetical protein
VEQFLPLLHHAIAVVVQHDDLDRQVVGGDRFHLADVHAHRRVAVDVDDQVARVRELRADRRRQAEAHGAHRTRGEPQARPLEVEVLGRPHLVLAHARGDDRLALRDPVDLLEHVVRLDQLAVAVVVEREFLLHVPQVREPLGTITLETCAPAVRGEHAQRLGQQAHVAPLHALHLVDLGAVDVEMRNGLGAGREFRGIARHAVIERAPMAIRKSQSSTA